MSAPDLPDVLTCEQAFALVYEYLDKALTPEEAERVNAHLAICEDCVRHFHFEGKLLDQIRQKCREARAPESLRKRIDQLLDTL
jgi:mycothiol system anti-sigma-R factor